MRTMSDSRHQQYSILIFIFCRLRHPPTFFFFFFNDTATTEIYTLSLHDALPICFVALVDPQENICGLAQVGATCHLCRRTRSEEHTSELQSRLHLVCRLLLEKKKINNKQILQVAHA